MKKSVIKKDIVFGIIMLLIGVSISSGVSVGNKNVLMPLSKKIWIVDNEGDGDFTTIRSAIENASDGDTIEVYSGTYIENITIYKRLTLKGISSEFGSHGSDTGNPIINASDRNLTNTINITCNHVDLSGFNITGSGKHEAGIRINAKDCIISNNTIHHNGFGIGAFGNNTIIMNNSISDNIGCGIEIYDRGAIINNVIVRNAKNSWESGISANNVNGLQIKNNTIIDTGLYGIYLTNCNNCNITENIIEENSLGISLYRNENCKFEKNTLSNNNHGIVLNGGCTSNTIEKNEIYYGYSGIELWNSEDNVIHYNKIISCVNYGIYLVFESFSNTITNNTLQDNFNGIRFENTYNNFCAYNNIKGTANISIYLSDSKGDKFLFNNIQSTNLFLLYAVNSYSYAILNWWGGYLGPLFRTFRLLLGIVFVRPAIPIKIPINSP